MMQSLDVKLDKLLELKDLVKDLRSAIARNKREKAIRIEIANVRRKMSLLASGKVQGGRKKTLKSGLYYILTCLYIASCQTLNSLKLCVSRR